MDDENEMIGVTHERNMSIQIFFISLTTFLLATPYINADTYVVKTGDNSSITEFRKAIEGYGNYIPFAIIEQYYSLIGPEKILDIFEEDPFCHAIAHNFGNIVLLKTNDLQNAIDICGHRCDEGCFHGVLEGLFKDFEMVSQENPPREWDSHVSKDEFRKKITQVCERPEFDSHEHDCYHAIGHVSMFVSEYDINEAIRYCQLLGKRAAFTCATGVYMEEMLANGRSNSSILYPCDIYLKFPAACYRYAFESWSEPFDYSLAIKQCLELDDRHAQNGCMHGVGFASYLIVNDNPALLPTVCSSGRYDARVMCIEGAAGKLNTHYPPKQMEACSFLKENRLRKFCEAARNLGTNKDAKYFDRPQEKKNLLLLLLDLLKR